MKRLLILLAATSAPALAQHQGHGAHQHHEPAPQVAPLLTPQKPAADPHAGHAPEAPGPHAGHGAQEDPHAGHGPAAADPAVAPPPAAARSGPEHAADLIWDKEAMVASRRAMHDEHGSMETFKFLVDQLEAKVRNGRDGYAWDAQAWYGGDIDKLWLKTEGEGEFRGSVEQAEVQALWSRAIDPWFDLQIGVRHDFRPDPERTHLVVGVQGLAPYWFEIDAAAFISDKGDVTARVEAEHDVRLTQKLIFQPRAELDFSLQDVPEIGIGSGLSSAEVGARLRYEFRPEYAPYVGVEYERAFGDTADFRRAAEEEAGKLSFLVGIRTWF